MKNKFFDLNLFILILGIYLNLSACSDSKKPINPSSYTPEIQKNPDPQPTGVVTPLVPPVVTPIAGTPPVPPVVTPVAGTPTQVEKFILQCAKPAPEKFTVYRWGTARYELTRTKNRLGKGKPAFNIHTINDGEGMLAGRGLYAAIN